MSFGLVLCLWGATSGPGRLAGFRGPHLSLPPHPPAGAGAQRSSEAPLLRVVRTLNSGIQTTPSKAQRPSSGCFESSRLPPSGRSHVSGHLTRSLLSFYCGRSAAFYLSNSRRVLGAGPSPRYGVRVSRRRLGLQTGAIVTPRLGLAVALTSRTASSSQPPLGAL